ncbi:hypothetical protein F0562_013968 [Nyssa sinensis]|uniref:Uncharacterized protein n=1 Tax=Nyssa sinensis TaxID=561372 RepID=A0A5J4ZQJ8_9ASTE|nr:hypothetical protein F0562_013968 [Nyssa sinensis]
MGRGTTLAYFKYLSGALYATSIIVTSILNVVDAFPAKEKGGESKSNTGEDEETARPGIIECKARSGTIRDT